MLESDRDQEQTRLERELKIQRQIAFASGLFQGDVTIRTMLEAIAEGVVVIDSTGTILLVNSAAVQIFGYSRIELIGKPHAMLIPDRYRKVHEEHEMRYFEAPRSRPMGQLLDLSGRRKDGSEFPLEISLSYIQTINGLLVLAFISDITARKQYESRLKEKEELFRIQVECVKDYAIFMLDARGNVLNWNAGAERLKGYREEEVIGRHFSSFYPEEDRNTGKPEGLLKRAEKEGRVETEGWRVRKDGSRFWAEVIVTALRDENGGLRGFSKVTRDITERRRTEEALREAERKLRNIVEHSTNLFYMHTADHMLTYMSPQSRQFFDCEPEEAQVPWTDFITDNPANRAAIEATQRAIDTGQRQPPYQVECIGRTGRKIWVEVHEAPVVEKGKTVALVGSLTDITDRKRAEEALRESEQRFAAFMRHLPAAAWMKDLQGRYVFANEEAKRIFSMPLEALYGRRDEDVFPPEAARQFRENDERVLTSGGSLQTTESLRQANGIEHHSIVSKFAVPGPDGQPAYIAGVAFDITDRKQREKEIERLNAELEAANRELEAFNYTVAHDLRKPLTVVNGYCQAIKGLCGSKLDEQCQDYLQEAYEGTLRMNRLIEALLQFARLARIEPKREQVELSSLALEVVAELKRAEPQRQAIFRIAEGVTVGGDANLLRVVLANLLGNAWKFTATREAAVIEFGVTELDGRPACFVRDNGAGFNMKDAEKLFLPFQRLPGAEEFRGFGIGLATVERIIRRHGGRVLAEGEPEKGATFYFTLANEGE